MIAQCQEVACSHLLVELHQVFRVPKVRLPIATQFFVAILRRMAEMLAMEFRLGMTFHIHTTRIPVTILCR